MDRDTKVRDAEHLGDITREQLYLAARYYAVRMHDWRTLALLAITGNVIQLLFSL